MSASGVLDLLLVSYYLSGSGGGLLGFMEKLETLLSTIFILRMLYGR